MLSVAETAESLGVTKEAVYGLLRSVGMIPARPGRSGRNQGARLSRSQVEELRSVRIRRLEEELRRARAGAPQGDQGEAV